MVITKKINIDLTVGKMVDTLKAVQGDENSRVVEITLLDNGTAWAVPEGATGVVRYRRADGVSGNYDTTPNDTAAVTFSDNIATVQLAPEVLAVPGPVHVTVGIVSGSSVLHTFVFEIDVQKNPGYNVTAAGGYYLVGTLPASGWGANKYLGTDENGNVVEMDAVPESGAAAPTDEQVAAAVSDYLTENPVESGATAEQAAQIKANADAIAEIQNPVTSWALTVETQKYTLDLTLEDGSTETHVIETDENKYPTKLTVNGVEIPGSVTVVEG